MDKQVRIATLYHCKCGWRRSITDTSEWRYELIDHPTYGPITQERAAVLDVELHDCYQNHLALRRSPRGHEVPVNYQPYGVQAA